MSITPEQASQRFSLAQRKFIATSKKIARGFSNRVSLRATVMPHMRTATGESRRRRKSDSGPLRILSGRLKRSLLPGVSLSAEGIERVTATGSRVTFQKGSRVPYARLHEVGGKHPGGALVGGDTEFGIGVKLARIPARPYFRPATIIEKRRLAKEAGREIKNMIVTTLRGQV